MAKIKHIAIATQDAEATAKFYIDAFGLQEIAKLDNPSASGYFLSDGDINLAILNFKNDEVAGPERGKEYSGLHHIGFQVDSLEDIAAKLVAARAKPRDDMNKALNIGTSDSRHANVEVKYGGPDGVVIDVSEIGWVGTS